MHIHHLTAEEAATAARIASDIRRRVEAELPAGSVYRRSMLWWGTALQQHAGSILVDGAPRFQVPEPPVVVDYQKALVAAGA